MDNIKAKINLSLSMLIFGTIGAFVKFLPFSSSEIAFMRGLLGGVFILFIFLLKKEKVFTAEIRKNLILLIISGGLIGVNWIFLFESYRYTTVATATLCYYMAPVFVIIASVFIFKEKLGFKKALCVLFAILGMVLVSDILKIGFNLTELKGVIFGISAAVFYSMVVLLNKKIGNINPFSKTAIQLISAALVVLPYTIFNGSKNIKEVDFFAVLILLVVCFVHTGLAYLLYFSAVGKLKAQTTAILSYLDPVVAICISAFVLKEKISIIAVIGAIIIILSTLISELPEKEK